VRAVLAASPELTTGLADRSAIECRTPAGGVRHHHNGNKWRYEGVCFRAELPWDSVCMSILENFDVDPETKRVLRIAVERTRMSLGLTDGLADGIIANQIIEFVGVVNLNHQLAQKWLEVLHQLVPATTFALLIDPTNTATMSLYTREMQAAARTLGVQIHVIQANSDADFDAVFASVRDLGAAALVIVAALPFISHIEQLAALTLRHAVPAIFPFREFAAAGGLVSYGPTLRTLIVLPASTQAGFSRARSLPTSQCNKRRRSSLCSILRQRRRSASKCRQRSLPAPTR
jgi:hypothetical protein